MNQLPTELSGSIHLSAEGAWSHGGTEFTNERVADLFHRSVEWDEASAQYVLHIGQQRATFSREDTAYFVADLDGEIFPPQLRLLGGQEENLRPETLRVGDRHQVYCDLQNKHRARFTRAAHQHLMKYASGEQEFTFGGQVVRLKRGI